MRRRNMRKKYIKYIKGYLLVNKEFLQQDEIDELHELIRFMYDIRWYKPWMILKLLKWK